MRREAPREGSDGDGLHRDGVKHREWLLHREAALDRDSNAGSADLLRTSLARLRCRSPDPAFDSRSQVQMPRLRRLSLSAGPAAARPAPDPAPAKKEAQPKDWANEKGEGFSKATGSPGSVNDSQSESGSNHSHDDHKPENEEEHRHRREYEESKTEDNKHVKKKGKRFIQNQKLLKSFKIKISKSLFFKKIIYLHQILNSFLH